jgi:hypothetical protein
MRNDNGNGKGNKQSKSKISFEKTVSDAYDEVDRLEKMKSKNLHFGLRAEQKLSDARKKLKRLTSK